MAVGVRKMGWVCSEGLPEVMKRKWRLSAIPVF